MRTMLGDNLSDYREDFPPLECKAAFQKSMPGTRVGMDASEWNMRRLSFINGWNALLPYRDELLKIAEQVGEKDDPFAAWEKIAPAQFPVLTPADSSVTKSDTAVYNEDSADFAHQKRRSERAAAPTPNKPLTEEGL